MKFLLREGYGPATVREIGDRLRAHGSGHHWIEKYRGETFILVQPGIDEAIMRNEFAELVEPIENGD